MSSPTAVTFQHTPLTNVNDETSRSRLRRLSRCCRYSSESLGWLPYSEFNIRMHDAETLRKSVGGVVTSCLARRRYYTSQGFEGGVPREVSVGISSNMMNVAHHRCISLLCDPHDPDGHLSLFTWSTRDYMGSADVRSCPPRITTGTQNST